MSSLTASSGIDYTSSAELLARSHRSHSHTSHGSSSSNHSSAGRHGHFPWGLVIGLLVLVALVVAVVFVVRSRRTSP